MENTNIEGMEYSPDHTNSHTNNLQQDITQNNTNQNTIENKRKYLTFKQRMKIRSKIFKERMKSNKIVLKERIKHKKIKIKQRIQEIKDNHQKKNHKYHNSKVNQINHQAPHENKSHPDKYCAHCGNRISFSGKFCPSCGVYQ